MTGAGEIGRLWVSIGAKSDEFNKELQSTQQKLQNVGQGFQRVGGQMTKYVTGPIVAIGVGLGKAAMDLEATEAKYNTVFAGMTGKADDFITKFKELTPATTASARSMASGIQDLLIPMGFMREEATDLTGEFFHAIGALTNFNSATHSAEDVTGAMQSALSGMYMPLRSLGINIDKTTVEQKAMEMGLADANGEVSKQAEAQALLALVYENSTDALEAYTEESLDAKTKMGLLKAEIIDVAAEFGQALLPVITSLVDGLRNATQWFSGLSESQQKTILIVMAVVAALGPLLLIIGKIIMVVSTLMPLFAALKVVFLALLGPVGIVIAIIAALIAIGVLLYKNWDEVKAFAINIWTSIKDFFSQTWENIKGIFSKALQAIWNFFTTYHPLGIIIKNWKQITDFFVRVWQGIRSLFSSALDWIKGYIEHRFNVTRDFIVKTFNAIKNFLLDIWNKIKSGVHDRVNALRETIVNVINNALEFIKGLPAQALQWGRDIIQGLINGIKNMAGNLKGAIRGVVDGAVNSVKSFLGISSPSKLFEGFGKNMGQGMEKGISATQGLVNRAVVEMSMPSPTMSMAAPSGGGSQTIVVELDGKTIARAIGKPFMNEVRVKTGLSI